MPPISKENTVLTAPLETPAASSVTPVPRHEDTGTGSRPQPVALEVPVTVNGARTVEGSDKREPFSETTKTVLIFGNGAVIRLGSPVSAGQLLFLTNEKTKKEVVCQVVKSKNYRSVSGYVELEFTESVVGFWGMRFPSDRIGGQAPAATTAATLPLAAKINPVVPISGLPKPVSPGVSAAPKIPEVKPAQVQASQIHAEVKTALQPRPEVFAPSSAALKPQTPPALTLSKPSAPPAPAENKPQPTTVAGQNSSEDLKLQAARLQEQLSSLLFSDSPTAKFAPPAPSVPPPDTKVVWDAPAQIFEVAKSEPLLVKADPPARTLPLPIKSSLDMEEVKIPSWLEPLARNAAAPAPPQEAVEGEKAKNDSEFAERKEGSSEPLPVTAVERISESALPAIGSLLPLEEELVITHERSSGGSGRGVLYGAIAAGVLLAAGSAWYLLHPADAVQGTTAPVTSSPSSQAITTPPASSVSQPSAQPVSQPVPQTLAVAPAPASASNTTPISKTPAPSAPLAKPPVSSQAIPITRDNTRGASTPIPAAATERISRPPAEPEPKKPALGEVHLASPKINRHAAEQSDGVDAPTISSGNADANEGGMDSGLAAGNGKQPAAPEVPLPIGGDVKSAKLISKVNPIYPALARNQHVTGDVRVDAFIDANGRVTTMKVISGPTLLHQAAMDALRQWKYEPATLDGKPVPMHLTVTLQFRLQ
jgi:protein TonB